MTYPGPLTFPGPATFPSSGVLMLFTNTFEGVHGTAVTAANSNTADPSSRVFDSVANPTGTVLEYDSTTQLPGSTTCLKVANPLGTSENTYCRWLFTGTTMSAALYGRIYVYRTENTQQVIPVQIAASATSIGRLVITTAGAVSVTNGSTVIGSTTATIPVHQWARIDFRYVFSTTGTGVAEAILYNNPLAGASVTDTVAVTGLTFTAAPDNIRVGMPISAANKLPYYLDHVSVSDVSYANLPSASTGTINPGPGLFQIQEDTNQSKLIVATNKPLYAIDTTINEAFVVVHGVSRSYVSARDNIVTSGGLAGAPNDYLVVAPLFADETDLTTPQRTQNILYWDSDWKEGDSSLTAPYTRPFSMTSFAVLDKLIQHFTNTTRYPNLTRITVLGHSAGGQLTQRFAVFSTTHANHPGYVFRFIVANPSSYLYLNADRWKTTSFGALTGGEQSACPTYDTYRWGLAAGVPQYGLDTGLTLARAQYEDHDVVYFLGSADTGVDADLDQTCAANWQGTQRLQRGQRFFAYLAHYYGAQPHRYVEAAGVGHTASGMYESVEGQTLLFEAESGGVSPPVLGMTVTFWALYDNGNLRCPLPDVESWTISPVSNDAGTLTLTYPASGINWAVLHESVTLDKDITVQVRVDGVVRPELQSTLFESSGDDVEEGAVWTYTGTLAAGRLAEAIVAPQGGMPAQGSDPDDEQDAHFYSATAGTIFGTLMLEAQARGTLSYMTYSSFSNTHDSNGVAWTKLITLKLAPGTNLLKVLLGLVEVGLCEFRVLGFDVRLYQPDGTGVDRTLTNPPVIFRTGQSLLDSPRKHTSRDTATAALVAGAEGNYRWASDASALARRGRRIEVGKSQGQIHDPGALTAYAAHYLTTVTSGRMEKTHGLTLFEGPVPFFDFDVGDWVWSDLRAESELVPVPLERLRVAQITLSMDSSGVLSGSVTLNDLIAEREAALAKRMQGLEGGTTIVGTSTARPVSEGFDLLAPKAPLGLLVTSLAQPSLEPIPRSAVFASWSPVTQNADNTPIEDLAGYIVQWRYLDAPYITNWNQLSMVTSTSADWGNVVAGEDIEVHVAAIDLVGNLSTWSSSVFHTTETDSTPPPIPSTPIVTEFLGTLTLQWDGLGSFGEVMPVDFQGVEIHRSTVSGFTPSSLTLVEKMLGPGYRNYPDLTLQTTYFFKLISYDKTLPTPNKSTPSAQAFATPAPIGYGDVAFKDVGNLVEDGSFEIATSRVTHAARSHGAWSFVSGGADHGSWFARVSGSVSPGSGVRELVLSPRIPTVPGQDYAYRFALRGTGVNASLAARIRWYKSDSTTSVNDVFLSNITTDNTGFWLSKESASVVAPALAVSFEIYIVPISTLSAGTWDVDRVEVRERIGTLLVQDLAVTNAKIADLSVGKLTSGSINAIMLMVSGMIRSAPSGARYELDAAGLRFYDPSSNIVFHANGTTGFVSIIGTFTTSTGNDSIVLTNDSGDPEINLYRSEDLLGFAQITAVGQSSDSTVDLVMRSGPNRVFSPNRETRVLLAPDEAQIVYADRPDGNPRGGQLVVGQSTATLSIRSSSGSGAASGGHIFISSSGVYEQTVLSGTERSTLQLADGTATLSARDPDGVVTEQLSLITGNQALLYASSDLLLRGDASLTLHSDNRIRMKGWFGDVEFHEIGADEAFFIGELGFGGGFTEFFVNYNLTLLSLPVTVYSIGGNPRVNGLKSQLHTGFTVWWTGNTDAGSLRYICARM